MDTNLIIQNLLATIQSQEKAIDDLITKMTGLEAELLIYKNKKNSNNSHTPPSRDENRPKKNQSLREKSGKKAGGQQGHEGKTLECSAIIDAVVEHKAGYCNCCGLDLTQVPEALIETRHVIDIPLIKSVCTEHRIYRKTCSCGHSMDSDFPAHLTAKLQYGPGVESLAGYLHARQYVPYPKNERIFLLM